MISIVIPTYNEKENIKPLFSRLSATLKNIKSEVIIIDDNSPDRTWEEAEKSKINLNIRVIRRFGQRGLSSAILRGFNAAHGDIIGVMDADLSHPPELIPKAITSTKKNDIVVASRYIHSGKTTEWSAHRRTISKIATFLVKPIINITDPMSGFFFIRRDVIEKIKINTKGFKILLDIVSDQDTKRIYEIPYTFSPRLYGSSKISSKIVFQYTRQLVLLYLRKIRKIIF